LLRCQEATDDNDDAGPENWFAVQKVMSAGAPMGRPGDGLLVVGADGPIDRESCALYDVVL